MSLQQQYSDNTIDGIYFGFQPYVSQYAPGWAITISLEPTFEVRERCGLSTSTRNMIRKIWPYQLPNMDPETLAKLVFCFENDP